MKAEIEGCPAEFDNDRCRLANAGEKQDRKRRNRQPGAVGFVLQGDSQRANHVHQIDSNGFQWRRRPHSGEQTRWTESRKAMGVIKRFVDI